MNEETKYVTWDVHNEFAKRIDDENDRQNHRLSLLEQNVEETRNISRQTERLAVNMENMVKSQNAMNKSLEKQGERIGALEKEPAEKWKQVSWVVLSVIVTAIVTFVLTKVGL